VSDLSPINFVTGTLGSGKSYLATRYIFKYLAAGKVVACNFDLVGPWWDTVHELRQSKLRGLMEEFSLGPDLGIREAGERYEARAKIRELAYRFDVQDDLYDYRLPGEGEDRGLLVLDEQALQMNSRNWEERKKKDAQRYGGNTMRALQFYINMRKLGWSSLVLSHSHEQLDNQLRHMGGAIIRCRNLSKVNIPFTRRSMFKKPRFVAIHIWPETKPVHIYRREVYGLNMRLARHYKSMEEFDANPEPLGIRFQTPPYRKVAQYPPQHKFTWDSGGANRQQWAREKLRRNIAPEPAPEEVYTGSGGSWRET